MRVTIKKATREMSAEIIHYVMQSRKDLFPMLDNNVLPADLQNFGAAYLTNYHSGFFVAYDEQNNIAGTIGLLEYNNRFNHFNYRSKPTCEVVKLYVEPQYRRLGLATKLVEEINRLARQQNIERLYLHTHPFLKGAKEMWQKNGFNVTLQEDVPVWQTIHMECTI